MGAALVDISPDVPVHVGIDNATTVMEGNKIINHLKGRAEVKLVNDDGSMSLGGKSHHYKHQHLTKEDGNSLNMATSCETFSITSLRKDGRRSGSVRSKHP